MTGLVSVVTVIHNSADVIAEMLAAVPSDAEVIVVDNASTDTGASVARAAREDVVLLTEPNHGFGAGCNSGARSARGDVLIFLNPDCRPCPGALETLAHAARVDRTSIFGPALLHDDNRPRHDLRRRSVPRHEILEALPASARWTPTSWRRDLPAADQRYRTGGAVDYLQGACLAIDRDTFLTLGGFDEDFFLYSEEETLCEAVLAAGGRCLYIPGARVGHVGGTSTGSVGLFALRHLYRSRAIFYRKRYGELLGVLACVAMALTTAINWMLQPAARLFNRHAATKTPTQAAALRGLLEGVRYRSGRLT